MAHPMHPSRPLWRFAPALVVLSLLLVGSPALQADDRPVLPGPLVALAGVPVDLVVHELDGDGLPDLIVATDGLDLVSVYPGTPGGGFDAVALGQVGLPSAPRAIDLGTVDGDAFPDLMVITAGELVLHLGNGDGTFAAGKTILHGVGDALDVLLVDLDGDDALDVVVPRFVSDLLRVSLGDGAGGFGPFGEVDPDGLDPRSVEAADLDGDGVPDLIVRNWASQNLSVLIGEGDGGFAVPMLLDTVAFPQDLAVGDLDGDTELDLVVMHSVGPNPVVYWLGAGDGTFGPRTPLGTPGLLAGTDLALGDLEGDGDLDLVVEDGPTSLQVVHQEPGFTFPSFDTIDMSLFQSHTSLSIALVDLDGDGQLDITAASDSEEVVGSIVGDGSGGYDVWRGFDVVGSPRDMAIGDLDADGHLDVGVMTNHITFQSVMLRVLLGDGAGGLAPSIDTEVMTNADGSPLGVAFGRLDADPWLDAVVIDSTGDRVHVLAGLGDGTFGPQAPFFPSPDPVDVEVADVDQDGFADIVCVHSTVDDVSVLPGQGDGSFAASIVTGVGAGAWPVELDLADLDLDGDLDIVTANAVGQDASVLLGNGDGSFAPAVRHAVAGSAAGVSVGDLDLDGVPDVAVGHGLGVAVLEGLGGGSFAPAVEYALPSTVRDLVITDMDDDGLPDVVASVSPGGPAVMLGSGDLGLGDVQHFQGRDDTELEVVDLDGDFAPDVIVGFAGVTVHPNLRPTRWTDLGGAALGAQGLPRLVADGALASGTTLALDLTDAPSGAALLAWLSFASVPANFFGGTLYANPPSAQFLRFADGFGDWSASLTWPAGIPSGTNLWLQFLVQDLTVPDGITLSNAIRGETP